MNTQSSLGKTFALESEHGTFPVKFTTAAMCRFEVLQGGGDFSDILDYISGLQSGKVSILTIARLVQAGAKFPNGSAVDHNAACALIDEIGLVQVNAVVVEAAIAALPTSSAETGDDDDEDDDDTSTPVDDPENPLASPDGKGTGKPKKGNG